MAAHFSGANITINSVSGNKSIDTILGTNQDHERVYITAVQTGPNPGVVHVGGSNVSASVFGGMIRTGETMEYRTITPATVDFGSNLFVFNPSLENVRVEVIAFGP